MGVKRLALLSLYLKVRAPTLEGEFYTIKNPFTLFRKSGSITLSNGYSLEFNKENKKRILGLANFCLKTGIKLGNGPFQWKYYPENEVIETHQGIRFKLKGIEMLKETFLYQIHFSDSNFNGKSVVTAGAFVGDTPLFYSYYGAQVFSFEPSPSSYEIANENIALNPNLSKNIVLNNFALGNEGMIEFPVEEDSGGSSIYDKKENVMVRNIRSATISTILTEFSIIDPYLLDLDIKGAEFDIINDGSISKFKKVRIEYSPYYFLNDDRKTLQFLLEKLKEYGFTKIRIYKHNDLRFDLANHGTIEAEK